MKFKEVLTDEEKKALILGKGGRLLLKDCHPDLGGDPTMFIKVKEAIEKEDTDFIMGKLKEMSERLGVEEAEKKRKEQEAALQKEKEEKERLANHGFTNGEIEKIDRVSDALKTINIGKEDEVKINWLNKESAKAERPTSTQEISLDDLKSQVAKDVEWAKGIKIVNFNQKKTSQEEGFSNEDYCYEEIDTPAYSIEGNTPEEISLDSELSTELPLVEEESFIEDEFNRATTKAKEGEDGLNQIKAEVSEKVVPDLPKEESNQVQNMPKIEEIEALFPENSMADASIIQEKTEEISSNENEVIEDIPMIKFDEAEQEQEGLSKETATVVKELASKELAMDALWKKMEKGKEIGKRFGIKHDILSEIMKEYQKLKQEYDNLKNRLVVGLKIEEQKISEEISAKKQELGEMTSRLKLGKVKEYLSHNRKLSEYQEEMLLGPKQSLFKKIMVLAQNRQVQMVIGAALIGVSIAAPPTGFVHLITGGALPGFLPEALGPVAKGVGGVMGGYLAGGLAGLRRKDDDDIDRIVEAENEDIARMYKETKFDIPTGESFARNISYMTLKNPVIKNNFLVQKRRFEES
ncbi:MAG: hypothetical protein MNSN_08760 [Minisyncoccus archaeiphilus]|jgi:hypothetical protein|uniref:hypothetical protein n=1 Tax=Minisyncoccus archaeiphilus TaxID=3238481 RepID=UPI002B0AAF6E|nr:MAG: hypothetical protein MNSN_08760 [Candidatus Parcubacteria bacterium]